MSAFLLPTYPIPSRPVSPVATDEDCWMDYCTHRADGYISHPMLGIIPACYTCAQISGYVIGDQCSVCFKWVSFGQAHYLYPCGDGTPSTDAECDDCARDHILSCMACLATMRDSEDRS